MSGPQLPVLGRVPVIDAVDARALPVYWRSLSDLYAAEECTPEFPSGADLPPAGMDRRSFVRLLGASMALAGVSGCFEEPREQIVPYVRRPIEVVPGVPLSYATAMTLDAYATGLLVQAREGRPIKVEGNPAHPASLGAAGVHEQSALLQLYDPFRMRDIREADAARGWDDVRRAFAPDRIRAGGRGLHVVLEPTASPFTVHWIERLRAAHPSVRFHVHSPLADTARLAATRHVFGRVLEPVHDYRAARVIVALDCDFTATGPFHLRYARDFADGRRIARPSDTMNRLYAAGPVPSPTQALADHALPVRASAAGALAGALAAELNVTGAGAAEGLDERARAWVAAAASDLRARPGESLVVAGPDQPPDVHALAFLINHALGNTGRTEHFIEAPQFEPENVARDLAGLAAAIEAGAVETLVVLGGNPVYTSPPDLRLGDLLQAVPESLYLGLYANETAAACRWRVPQAHWLEAWGDARALDGTVSVVQPLIRPLYRGVTVDAVLAALAGGGDLPMHDALRAFWQSDVAPSHAGTASFDEFWEETLRSGIVQGSAAPPVNATPSAAAMIRTAAASSDPSRIEVELRPDPAVLDGRFANNAWLQELPDPVTKLTWGNAALMGPALANRLGVQSGDHVRIAIDAAAIEIPALPVPGHADAITLSLGYGREGAEETARGHGVSVQPLLRRGGERRVLASVSPVLDASGAARRTELASTQTHWSMEGREIVMASTLDGYRRDPEFTHHLRGEVASLYHGPPLTADEQWAMTIDLSVCTGCSACVVACQAENNIPVVGREGVLKGREMHWMRVDRYMTGDPERPGIVHQPMPCQHCESAPCEYVCPVNATVHSDDGLNEMVYNRCIGTRFCSNNCPYKVRRFNWFDYNAGRTDTESLVLNPDVTVRERGVMEKCTYCVQRIRRAGRQARIEGRAIGVDEVRTACQQACPTRAIVFGSLTDPGSDVAATRRQPRIYSVLHELGTEPRTQYLARISNPNPALRRDVAEEERPL